MKNIHLFSISDKNFRLNHLLIILVLGLSLSISVMIRSLPSEYGNELHEFDPFFNYRATQYLVENGFNEYLNWNDDLSWYPKGRLVIADSQVILHIIAGLTYQISGFDNLYDYTIAFPVIFGSLTGIIVFAIVRLIAGTSAGLIASLLFSISIPIIIRGQIGWFKSEPLGLFLGLLATYLFLSSLLSSKPKLASIKFVISGIIFPLSLSAWGGDQFFLIPISITILSLSFIKKIDKNFLFLIPCFTISYVITSIFFEMRGNSYIFGSSGLVIIFPTFFFIGSKILHKFTNDKNLIRNSSLLLFLVILILIIGIFLTNAFNTSTLGTFRYLNAILPTLSSTDPLTASVSEHQALNIHNSFQFHSLLMIFAGIGIWILFLKKNILKKPRSEIIIFTLTFGIFGAYIGSSFMRLEVFTSLGIIFLSSIGIASIIGFLETNSLNQKKSNSKIFIKFGVFSLLLLVLIIPATSVFSIAQSVPTILNGGTAYAVATNDWIGTLEWIKNNTPNNSVIGAWWDYGYWIQTISDRPSLVDNSTTISHRIETIAKIFFSEPEVAWNSLEQMGTDYFVVFVAGERLVEDSPEGVPLYILGGGGDESKKYWFANIAGVELEKFLESDLNSGTEEFWKNTFLGKLIPFTKLGYVNFNSFQFSENYVPGLTAIYVKDFKFIDDDGPFRLVHYSPSLDSDKGGVILGVLVYEINHNYIPKNTELKSVVIEYSECPQCIEKLN